jgi:hypothetical protein
MNDKPIDLSATAAVPIRWADCEDMVAELAAAYETLNGWAERAVVTPKYEWLTRELDAGAKAAKRALEAARLEARTIR